MNDLKVSNFLIYENEDGKVDVNVILKNETIWLTQKSMAELFDKDVKTINKHLINIFEESELNKNSTISNFEIVQKEGKRQVKRNVEFYNLDAIIAVGYRVNSKSATKFRIWATNVLKDYIIKGYVLDKEKLKNGPKFGKDYFDELLEEIKEIRLSERRLYQKITDLFELTSADYNKDSEEAYTFFKIVQNKLHYAISGHTAAELIFKRVDSKKENMGLTTWNNAPNGRIIKYDVSIAKNYLNKEELKKLENLTEIFLNVAQTEAEEQNLMTMQNWINVTDDLLKYRKKSILKNSGNISHKEAVAKAKQEYEKYRVVQDQKYISSMDEMYEKYFKEQNGDKHE